MKCATSVVLAYFLLSCFVQAGEQKSVRVNHVLKAIGDIYTFAKTDGLIKKSAGREMAASLDRLFNGYTEEELGRIAVIAWELAFPCDAEDVDFDKPFAIASWCCIVRLSKQPGEASAEALAFIERRARFDGSDKVAFDEMMERFNKELKELKK